MLRSVVEKMVNDGKGDKNLFSVVGTMMNTFTKSKSVSRDEASYMLGGGVYKRMTMPVKKCSVSSVYLDDIKENATDENGDEKSTKSNGNRLIWSDVVKQYKKRNSNDEGMNVYKFFVKCMFPKETFALQFIGFDQVAMYPLKEEYSKWILIIFKPWRDDPGSLKVDGAFSSALDLYPWDVNIPRRISLEILRRKFRFITDHSEDILGKIDLAQTPTEEGGRRNEEHEL